MGSFTPVRNFYKPDIGETGWAVLVNAIFDALDDDIDFGGQLEVWPSGGISITSGTHADPGSDALTTAHYLTVNNSFDVNGESNFDGRLEHTDTAPAEFIDGIQTDFSFDNLSATPTDAELKSAFYDPAPEGFMGIVDDDGNGTDMYLVIGDGLDYFYLKFTKAT